jgi:Cof subfamily protein (haloacid dehalogenase superfamily)
MNRFTMGTHSPPQFRFLACDLDGTLMGDDTTIRPSVHRALAAAQARGIHVTLATGRSFPATLPFARQLNISLPLICYQGGLIKHPLTGERIYQATMERSLLREVIDLAHVRDWHLVVYINDTIYVQDLHKPRSFYFDLLGTELRHAHDLRQTVIEHDQDPAKFIIVADKAEADHIQAELSAHFHQQMAVVRSHDLFVEGNPLGVNKGDALRRLSNLLGVPQAQVMAIGDQGNDVKMITWAGLGVAMGSGSDAAKAAADWIAPPLLDDGAAVAIQRFLLI